MNERSLQLQHLEKIARSQVLHGSESLCRLLHYLGEHALNHPGEHLKEYQIATEIFGRPSDFNPQSDSTVRVQVGRLRSKLAEYYNAEGAEDPILVDLPKGSYAISFHHRETTPKTVDSQTRERMVAAKPTGNRQWRLVVVALCYFSCSLLRTGRPFAASAEWQCRIRVSGISISCDIQQILEGIRLYS